MDLTELADRLLISQTLSVYCDTIDRVDMPALAEVFTEDVLLDMGNGAVFSGRERVVELVRQVTERWSTTHHQCSNHLVGAYDGERAASTSYIYAYHDSPVRDETMHLWGRYSDELLKQDGTWRIRVRRLRVAGVTVTPSRRLPERFERPERP